MALEREGADVLDGGLVTGKPPHEVGAAESPNCTNADPADPWGMTTRMGSAVVAGIAPTVNSGHSGDVYLSPLAGATQFIVRGASVVYNALGAGSSWTTLFSIVRSNSSFTTTATFMDAAWGPASVLSTASTIYPIAVITVDNMLPQIWNQYTGSVYSASLASTDIAYTFAEVYANRVFLAGKYGDWPNRVEHSALNDATDYSTANNAGKFYVGGGGSLDAIISTKATRNAIYWFQRNAIHMTTGASPFDFETGLVTNNFGCVSRRGTATDGQGVYFASDDGIYYVNGLSVTRVSDKVRETYINIPDKSKIVLSYKGEKLYCFHNSSGSNANDAGLVAAPRRKMESGDVQAIWSKWGSVAFGAAFVSASNSIYGLTSGSSMKIYQLETGSGASNTISYRTPDYDFRNPEAKKLANCFFMHVRPTSATQTWTAQWLADGASAGSSYSIAINSGASHAYVGRQARAGVNGNYLALELSYVGQTTLYGITAYAEVQAEGDIPRVME